MDDAARAPLARSGARHRGPLGGDRNDGLVTYAYFSLASHTLSESDYGQITLLWSAVFITVSVLYRPVEQLLSRTIADRDARGQVGTEHLRVAATIQLVLALAFAALASCFASRSRTSCSTARRRSTGCCGTVLAYAVSYFARGFLAGHRRFGLYGGLVLMEACTRVAVRAGGGGGTRRGPVGRGAGHGLAAPMVSLAVVPWATRRRLTADRAGGRGRAGR